MDLRLSYHWLKEHLQTKLSAQDFAQALTRHSMTVDRVEKVSPVWRGVITARITAIAPHPQADRLRLATVDDGRVQQTVVCGAPNIAVGQVVPLARVGATVLDVPTGKPHQITAATIRGVESQGMLCATDELGVGDDHSGIWVLPAGTPVGVPLEKVYPAEDVMFHVEVTSNRPDAMGVIGLAREAAAVVPGVKWRPPAHHPNLKVVGKALPLAVRVAEPRACPRYTAIVLADVAVGPSPLWLQACLIRSGVRPINNVVDVTNYVRLEYGQPLHAFDYARLAGVGLAVRRARERETLASLDGKNYALRSSDLVIADANGTVALAGVMGGESSGVTAGTTSVVLESATFDAVAVRKTSRRLSLISDSSLLFEKGLSPLAAPLALERAVGLLQQVAGARVASRVFDRRRPLPKPRVVSLRPAAVNGLLGVELNASWVRGTLVRLGFRVAGSKTWRVTVPWWRGDVAQPQDLAEEVARAYGYDAIAPAMPSGSIPLRSPEPIYRAAEVARTLLVNLGYTELVTYSLVSQRLVQAAGIDPRQCLRVVNPLSAEFEVLRPALVPSVLAVAGENVKRLRSQQLFELSRVFRPGERGELPEERLRLVAALVGDSDEVFYAARGVAELLLRELGVTAEFTPLDGDETWQAGLELKVGDEAVGIVGLAARPFAERFGLQRDTAVVNLDFTILAILASDARQFTPIPAFPGASRDLSLVVRHTVPWADLQRIARSASPLIRGVEYLGTYSGGGIPSGTKGIACRLQLRANDRTLSSAEVDDILKTVVGNLGRELGASLRT